MNQRRSNPHDDLRPEDLFRPEPEPQQPPQAGYGYPGPGTGRPGAPDAGHGGPGPWGAPAQPQGPADPPAAAGTDEAATQYLPQYGGAAPGGGGGYPQGEPAATQRMPTLPPQSFGAGGAPAAPAHGQDAAPGYGHPQPGQGGYGPAAGYSPSGYAQDGGPDQGYGGYGDDSAGFGPVPGRRLSGKAIAGIVVAACAVVGIGAGALLGGGDDGQAPVQASPSVSAPASGGDSASPRAAGADALRTQAQALSALLGRASSSRSAVIHAVSSIRSCTELSASAQALRSAAGQRTDLVRSLGALKMDHIPHGDRLRTTLGRAWQASAEADTEYAAWAGDMVRACRKHKARRADAHLQAGNAASGRATIAKREAAALWNPVADRTGLPRRSPTQL